MVQHPGRLSPASLLLLATTIHAAYCSWPVEEESGIYARTAGLDGSVAGMGRRATVPATARPSLLGSAEAKAVATKTPS